MNRARIGGTAETGKVRFRRAGHVVFFWADGRFVWFDYATGRQAGGHPLVCEILDACGTWQTADRIGRLVSGVRPVTLTRLLDGLVEAMLLERSDRPPRPEHAAMSAWGRWNPGAGLFHAMARQGRYVDPMRFERELRVKAQDTPPPPVRSPAARGGIRLPWSHTSDDFTRVLASRRTWRQFGKTPVDLNALGDLLRLTGGVFHWLHVPGLGELPLTTSPSGGARHPIELYVLVRRVRGMTAGLYHYAADRHALRPVRRGASRRDINAFIPHQPWYGGAAAVVFFAARFARTQWRYDFPRAYRAVLLEAGHVCQTFLLTATWLGLAPFCTMALHDDRIEKALGIDGVSEAVLYAAGVGARPGGLASAVEPPGMPPPRVRTHRLGAGR
jgi:SagB-type dehydrogenase family enzyme